MTVNKLLIAGSRGIINYGVLVDLLTRATTSGILKKPTAIISGCARGVDTLGERYADDYDYPVVRFPAQWRVNGKYNPRAGHERNSEMLLHCDSALVLWDGLSSGTGDTIKKLRLIPTIPYVVYLIPPTKNIVELESRKKLDFV